MLGLYFRCAVLALRTGLSDLSGINIGDIRSFVKYLGIYSSPFRKGCSSISSKVILSVGSMTKILYNKSVAKFETLGVFGNV